MVFPVDGCSSLGLSSSLTVIDTDEKEESSNNNITIIVSSFKRLSFSMHSLVVKSESS